jgi:malonyl-CoA O-methyltransferase
MPKARHTTSSSVTARFSAAAGTYHRNAKNQRLAAKQLLALLSFSPAPARILEIGCGTGVLTEKLAKAFPPGRIDAVDVSRAMTVKARKRLAGNRMIRWIVADATRLPEKIKYPLIISNCTLHWIAPIKNIIGKLCAMLEPGGILAFAVMTRGTFAELNACRRRTAPRKPARVVLPARDEIKKAVARAGLRLKREKTALIRQTFSSPEKLLKQLHDQGLTGGNIPHRQKALTRSELLRLVADYRKRYRSGRGIYATYRVYYCVAQKI